MMVNLLDDSNFHRQTALMTRLIEIFIQNPVFGISCIISILLLNEIIDLFLFEHSERIKYCYILFSVLVARDARICQGVMYMA